MEADDDNRRAATASAPPPAAATNNNEAAAIPRPSPPRDWSPAKQAAPLEQKPCASEASVHYRPPPSHWGSDADADASATPTTSERSNSSSDGGADSLASADARRPPGFCASMTKLAMSAARAALQEEVPRITRATAKPNSAALARVRVRVEDALLELIDKYGQRHAVGSAITAKRIALAVVVEAGRMGIVGIGLEEFEQICKKSARQRLQQASSDAAEPDDDDAS